MSDVLNFDKKHLWHPYTSIEEPLPVYHVESASGVRLHLRDGSSLIDGMSSWWAVIHGYDHPKLLQALRQQSERMCHVMFGGITHEPAVELGKQLVAMSPTGLEKIFLCDSGSVAVEVAMKMALQYFHAEKKLEKKKFLTIRSGYHGDTFHAMSVCDPVTGMHHIYSGVLPQYYFAQRPGVGFRQEWDDSDIDSLREIVENNHQEICAVILEPIVQGAGGMWFYHPQYLKEVRAICDRYDILLIADEIATGFGRSGRLFGCNHAGVCPDIMCLGKALTGGYMTLAAVLTTQRVGMIISSGEPGVFMHGPTFMANPLACSVAQASLAILQEGHWREQVSVIAHQLEDGLSGCREMKHVRDVRVLGAIGVVELENPVNMGIVQKKFVKRGVWVRPFGRLVYLMPPYCIELDDLVTLTKAVTEVVYEEHAA